MTGADGEDHWLDYCLGRNRGSVPVRILDLKPLFFCFHFLNTFFGELDFFHINRRTQRTIALWFTYGTIVVFSRLLLLHRLLLWLVGESQIFDFVDYFFKTFLKPRFSTNTKNLKKHPRLD